MERKSLNAISTVGVIISLVLSVWYLIKTYQAGNPKWYFLIMACGIAIMLAYGAAANRGKRRNRRRKR
ncbi:MAG: hypothetical protein GY816_19290 [Cytophagales bacterium]|nr:hypothetical protein [Cytophagales bacterium]